MPLGLSRVRSNGDAACRRSASVPDLSIRASRRTLHAETLRNALRSRPPVEVKLSRYDTESKLHDEPAKRPSSAASSSASCSRMYFELAFRTKGAAASKSTATMKLVDHGDMHSYAPHFISKQVGPSLDRNGAWSKVDARTFSLTKNGVVDRQLLALTDLRGNPLRPSTAHNKPRSSPTRPASPDSRAFRGLRAPPTRSAPVLPLTPSHYTTTYNLSYQNLFVNTSGMSDRSSSHPSTPRGAGMGSFSRSRLCTIDGAPAAAQPGSDLRLRL